MQDFERLGYAAIITAERANQLITERPRDFPVYIARAERHMEEFQRRAGRVRVLYQDGFGGLFDMTATWTKPDRELKVDWFAVPEGTIVAVAKVKVYRSRSGTDRADLALWNSAVRWVEQWTQPGWFRCHACGRRTRRGTPGVQTTITGIFCEHCWTKYGRELERQIPEGGRNVRRAYACTP